MEAKEVITALGAVAHEHRLAVYRMLVAHGPEGLPAGRIAAALGVPPSSLTFHLHELLH
ncbi:MAG TPA: helix-turn-helix domain-containing protein, partial [Stellaceae bacterium]|nr:helix-turn-helix domain-containing protein [Stellaceae bacterium]